MMMVNKRGRLLSLILIALNLSTLSQALVYPLFSDDELTYETLLIPCLPRPMYSREDSPFKIFGSSKSYTSVSFSGKLSTYDDSPLSMTSEEYFKKLFLVSFMSQSDMEVAYIFDSGIRYADAEAVSDKLCLYEDPSLIQPSISETGSITNLQKIPLVYTPSEDGFQFEAVAYIEQTGYVYSFLMDCNGESEAFLHINSGKFVFRNPHGLLPGGWYLKLPFSGFISLGYFLFLLAFLIRSLIYREDLMYIQISIILVLIFGLIEQLSYYLTFLRMNVSGNLPCCPVASDMAFCLIISAVKRAVLVAFLLAASLGYGIQRGNMTNKEWTAVIVLGFLYLFAAVNYEVSLIEEIDSLTEDSEDDSDSGDEIKIGFGQLLSSFMLTVLNLVVVSFIYFSLVTVIDKLKKQRQVAKQKMYETLSRALIMWFVIGFIAEVLFYIYMSDAVQMSWKYELVPKFIWDLLFFLVVLQIGWLWFPSAVTAQYAYATQLPQNEFDMEFEDNDNSDGEDLNKDEKFDGVELNSKRKTKFAIGNDGDDVEAEFDKLAQDSDDEDDQSDATSGR